MKIYRGLNRHLERDPEWYDTAPYYAAMVLFVFLDPDQLALFERAFHLSLRHHPAMIALQAMVIVGFIAALTLFVGTTVIHRIRRHPVNVPKLAFMGATLANVLLLVVTPVPVMLLIALETAYNDIQYQGWIRHYPRRRLADRPQMVRRGFWTTLVAGLVSGLMVLGGTAQMWLAHLSAAVYMIVPRYYYVDGLIWKVSRAPELAAVLAPAGKRHRAD